MTVKCKHGSKNIAQLKNFLGDVVSAVKMGKKSFGNFCHDDGRSRGYMW